MPSFTTQAIVLRRVNYRDNDRMLTLFSPTLGRLDAAARGCRKTKSALGGATELFCSGEYQFHQSRDRYTLTGCAIQESFYPLREDYDRLVYGAYLLALCEASVQPGEEHPGLYALLLGALARLAYGAPAQSPAALTVVFLLQFAESLGYRPRLDACAHCGIVLPDEGRVRFGALAGGTLCPACGVAAEFIQSDTLRFLRAAQRTGFDCEMDVSIAIQNQAVWCMRTYLESRVERTIKAARLLPGENAR
ncbi:MAG: DNA repair protein RecO [Clostridia bacterium]|nr:DNA repair protein RecO [Clostridia bacterium]